MFRSTIKKLKKEPIDKIMKKNLTITLLYLAISFPVFSQEPPFIEGELIIRLQNGQQIEKLVYDINHNYYKHDLLRVKKLLSKRLNIWLLQFDAGTADMDAVIVQVYRHKGVIAAQKNHLVSQRATVPNDTQFSSMWNMNNTGQAGGLVDADIDAPEAWDLTTGGITALGDTIVVAVIDGGFDLNHVDLNFWKNLNEIPGNSIDDDGNGYVDDYNGWNAYNSNGNIPSDAHGTHVAGTVGAKGNNGIGVTGVNWNVKVMPVAGSSGDEATVVEAYGYVLEMRALYNSSGGDSGAFVVSTNSSFGVNNGKPANFPIWCAFYDSLGAAGVLSAAATMNVNSDVDITSDIPTACPSDYMISVTNTTNTDLKNSGAAYGYTTIDLGAPGTNINSTTPGNTYSSTYTGTSMATPHVAGAIGLLYSVSCPSLAQLALVNPQAAALQVRQYLFDGVDSLPALSGITVTGGRLNLYNSVMEVVNNCSPENCFMPDFLQAANVTSSAATLNWSSISDSLFNVRYRQVGDTIWISDTTSSLSYGIANLIICTGYEFQAEAVCSIITSGYSASSVFNTSCVISIENVSFPSEAIKIYPNPAYGFVNILPGEGITDMQVEVLDVIGKTVQTGIIHSKTVKPNLLNLENLSKGIYLIRLYGEGWQYIEKLILF